MKRIALTGGIACGKSLVGHYLEQEGIPVCDADQVARDVMAPGGRVAEAVLREFGPAIEGAAGTIDRTRLAALVFGNPDRLAALNRIVHPAVRDGLKGWLDGLPATAPLAVAIIPLLYEVGMDGGWDGIVAVGSPAAQQWRRLLERGLTEEEARQRLAAQWPQGMKMERADWVIFNNGTREQLRDQVRTVIRLMMES